VNKHQRTLSDILEKKANIKWTDIEVMLKHIWVQRLQRVVDREFASF
jgi:hypothetical protein